MLPWPALWWRPSIRSTPLRSGSFSAPGAAWWVRRRWVLRARPAGWKPSVRRQGHLPLCEDRSGQGQGLAGYSGGSKRRPCRVALPFPATRARSLVARLLIESGPTFATSAQRRRKHPFRKLTAAGSKPGGVEVQFRASLEQDLAAIAAFDPASLSAPLPWCRRQRSLPFLPFISRTSPSLVPSWGLRGRAPRPGGERCDG